MAGHELDDAWLKLWWARQNFDAIDYLVEAFEKEHAHCISVDVNAETGTYTFYVHGLRRPSEDWGLRIGDCLHNTRTALDYLMVQLVARVTGRPPREIERIQFPIYDDPGRFAGAVAEVRKEPLFSGYLARIEELQPYNATNPSIWGVRPRGQGGKPQPHPLPTALARLSTLDNVDKHRVIHATWLGVAFEGATFLEPPEGFKDLEYRMHLGPLEDAAKVGHVKFETPLPCEWEPEQVDMKRAFPIQVAIDEPGRMQGVRELLPFCMWGAERVLGLFAPVFEANAPPLPVTAEPETPEY